MAADADHPKQPPAPQPSGSCGAMPIQATFPDHSGHGKHYMADFDLEALSLSELKKMQKDIAKAITTKGSE